MVNIKTLQLVRKCNEDTRNCKKLQENKKGKKCNSYKRKQKRKKLILKKDC